jgi:glycosyltransferase involved in cell wall biosynthesis
MKVLFVTGEFPPMQGGVGDYTAVLARTLCDLGASASVLTSEKAAGLEDKRVVVFPNVRRWGWGSLDVVAKTAGRWGADVVHIQYQAAAYGLGMPIHLLPAYMSARLPRARRVVTFHDLKVPYLFPKAGRARTWALARLMRDSHAVIVTNREDEAEYANFGVQRPPHLIPIGSNIAPRLPQGFDRVAWRARWNIAPEDTVLAYFGFLNSTKGGGALISALGELTRRGRPMRLLMIGGKFGASDPTNEQFARQLEDVIAREGVANRVVWTGFLKPEEVSAAFAVSDMAVLPYADGVSFRRGSLMAALTHSVPLITTVPRVHLPELIPEENVILVPPEQPLELADAVMRVADHAGLRARLGEGAQRLSQNFAWDKIAQDTLAIYESLVAGGAQ